MTTHESELEDAIRDIEVPDAAFEAAVAKYKSLTDWLERPASALADSEPRIAPQGSFALGTAIRPIGRSNEYDVDLICRLNWSKSETSQYRLKQAVGNEVCKYAERHAMSKAPEDKRRCWTIEYADGTKFHIDILPCILDATEYRAALKGRGIDNFDDFDRLTEDALAITDKTAPTYFAVGGAWPSSNPLGYAQWFKDQQKDAFSEARSGMVRKGLFSKAEDVPEYKIKTPLQKAIMLLKRHRDSMFSDDGDKKPISIIITTLAARAYRNTEGLVETLSDILPRLDESIEYRDGNAWVGNPVNPAENFADRWAEDDELASAFDDWLRVVRQDFGAYIRAARPGDMPKALRNRLAGGGSANGGTALAASTPSVTPERLTAAVTRVQERRSATAPWAKLEDD